MPAKFKIVVSDLHLGAGPVTGENPLEDFLYDGEFAALLDQVATESEATGAEVELIFDGDAFEMLQVPHVQDFDPGASYEPEQYHSSLEEDSARKMDLVVAGHGLFFGALREFIQTSPPQRRVTFIKGNHDLDLHWPAVQDRIRRAMAAEEERAPLLVFEERRIRREGIYVEHGNQYAERVDRIKDMEEPHDPDRPGQLALPPGSWFVMDIFNRVERERYWIDGIKPITALVWYALKYDFAFAARAISTLIRSLPGALHDAFLALDEPEARTLADQLADPAEVEILAERYEKDPAFRARFNGQLAQLLAPPADEGPGALSVTATPDPVAMGQGIQDRVRSSLFDVARRRAMEEGVDLVIFGHTHEPGEELLPGGGRYINSGTWTWRADFGGAGKESWQDLFRHPERFTDDVRLTYVRIDYDAEGRPSGRLVDYQPGGFEGDVEDLPTRPVPAWVRFLVEIWLRWEQAVKGWRS